MLEIAASARSEAPPAAASIKVLADPLPGLPLPQLVLIERGRPPDELPVPWDLRTFNEPVRTIRHTSRQDRDAVIGSVERLLVRHRPLTREVAEGRVIVSDAVGILLEHLPANLHVIQYFRFAEYAQPGLPATQGPGPDQGTTSTTTAARIRPATQEQPCLRLMLLRGAVSHSIEIGDRHLLLDVFLFELLERHHRDAALPETFGLELASAQPPRQGYHQEVILVVIEEPDRATICWDGRGAGSPLMTCAIDAFHRLQLILAADWQRNGWTLAVNGISVTYNARNARDGDFVQPFRGRHSPAATPLSWILECLPALQPFAWRLMGTLDRLQFYRSLRHRRQQLGFHFLNTGVVRLLGPTHGDILMRTGRFDEPELLYANQAVGRLAQFPQALQVWDTPLSSAHRATFVTNAPNSNWCTVLVPAPGFPGHHFVMLTSPQAEELIGLPVLPHHIVWFPTASCVTEMCFPPFQCRQLQRNLTQVASRRRSLVSCRSLLFLTGGRRLKAVPCRTFPPLHAQTLSLHPLPL